MTGDNYAAVAIEGGNGGDGGGMAGSWTLSGSNGGDGASAEGTVNASSAPLVAANVVIQAGEGGNGGDTGSFGSNGGNGGGGGDATLNATGKVVEVQVEFSMNSGLNGANGTSGGAGIVGTGGNGGDAVFGADTLIAPVINLTKNDGDLFFTVDMLNVSVDTAVNLKDTVVSDVAINGLSFSDGSNLTVDDDSGSGAMTFAGSLSVAGSGNALNTSLAYDATGKALSFDLAGVTAANSVADVMLSTSGSAGVTLGSGTTLAITNTDGLTALALGGKFTLIENTTGSLASQTLADVTASGVTHGLVANVDTGLYIFKNRVETIGDYAITGPYNATAGMGTNESVTLDVGGTLTVAGDGALAMTSSSANSATLNAGKIDAASLTLDNSAGGGVNANVAAIDVTGRNVTVTLDSTASANVSLGDLVFDSGYDLTVVQANAGTAAFGGKISVTGQGSDLNPYYS